MQKKNDGTKHIDHFFFFFLKKQQKKTFSERLLSILVLDTALVFVAAAL